MLAAICAAYLELVHYPLAVRSSSLLEDSQYQPLAGVYETYMLPNNHPDDEVRLRQLVRAVKRVYASTFLTYAKNYFKVTPYRLEEEKMAVIIQKMVGSRPREPLLSRLRRGGPLAQLLPVPACRAEDGVVAVALGLGRTVVDGERALAFSPRYPQHLLQFSTVDQDMLANSQREFIAVELERGERQLRTRRVRRHHFRIELAEADGTLAAVASTYSPENDAVYDGIVPAGRPAGQLRPHPQARPLPAAADLRATDGDRPLGHEHRGGDRVRRRLSRRRRGRPRSSASCRCARWRCRARLEELDIDERRPGSSCLRDRPACWATARCALARHRGRWTPSASTAREAAEIAARGGPAQRASWRREGVPYILIGLGRWGSADPWLGIPVTWEQIAGARVIVESGLKDIKVDARPGQPLLPEPDLVPRGLLHGEPRAGDGFVDWDWLRTQPARSEGEFVRHLRFDEPAVVKMDGRVRKGVIFKPGAGGASGRRPVVSKRKG